ncbi:MAG: type II toxin-antitoxin system prevent-host-death family antitoxin [Dehalococcoidia bacterium]
MAKTVGVRQLKNEATRIVREVREDGAEYVITVGGQPAAVLRPYKEKHPGMTQAEAMDAWLEKTEALAAEITALWPEGLSAAEAVAEQRR